MLDKNGIEIKTGDVVEVKDAYFKNDNGLFFVATSEGDPSWTGTYHSLHKISKTGKVSTAKYNLSSWPIAICTNDSSKKCEGKRWNAEHATIEIRNDINRSEVAKEFEKEADQYEKDAEYFKRYCGEESEVYKELVEKETFFRNVAKEIA